MVDRNGKPGALSSTLKAIRESVSEHDESLLRDMADNESGIRAFLIGGVRDDGIWPAGSFRVDLQSRNLHITLSMYSLEIEAKYSGDLWHGLWETIDTDLREGTTPWQLDYRGRERHNRKLLTSDA